MNFLRKIPFWGWLLINLVICYGIWNPFGYSVIDLWLKAPDVAYSVKTLITLVILILVALLAMETYRSLGKVGIFLYLALVAVILWVFHDLGWLTLANASAATYWGQIPIAFMLTLGSQFSKIYRAFTGRVTVEDPDTETE